MFIYMKEKRIYFKLLLYYNIGNLNMELKKVLLVVDNRISSNNDSNDNKTNPTIDFRGSAFKGKYMYIQLLKLMLVNNGQITTGKKLI